MTDATRPRFTHAMREELLSAARGEDGFLLEGAKAVADALRHASLAVRFVLVSEDAGARADDLLDAARERGVAVRRAPASAIESVSGTTTPQGVVAVVDEAPSDARAILAQASSTVLLLDGLQDPGNVGAVFRVAAAFEAAGVLMDEATAHPLRLKALRASAGTALLVPYAREPMPALLDAVRGARRPLWLLDDGGRDLFAVERVPSGLVLAVGGEGQGPGAALRAAADERVGIPMSARVESLNAAVAAGIAVAVLSRRRA
jgi:tRNA G18 (ribose-2'-O)-methylase SpoU